MARLSQANTSRPTIKSREQHLPRRAQVPLPDHAVPSWLNTCLPSLKGPNRGNHKQNQQDHNLISLVACNWQSHHPQGATIDRLLSRRRILVALLTLASDAALRGRAQAGQMISK